MLSVLESLGKFLSKFVEKNIKMAEFYNISPDGTVIS